MGRAPRPAHPLVHGAAGDRGRSGTQFCTQLGWISPDAGDDFAPIDEAHPLPATLAPDWGIGARRFNSNRAASTHSPRLARGQFASIDSGGRHGPIGQVATAARRRHPWGHDGALARSTPTPGSPRRVRPRRQPRSGSMSGVDLVVAFLAGVAMGVALDRWLLPSLVDAWIDRLRRHEQ